MGCQVRSVGDRGPRESWKASRRQAGPRPQEGAPGAGLREQQVVCSLTAFLESEGKLREGRSYLNGGLGVEKNTGEGRAHP